jgi:NAD(P)-dependent dehydrogenase (short-subunit alcohol dehydrogenase family)
MESLSGKVALITGAGSGIGRGTALHAASEGMHVVVADIKNSDGVAEEIKAAGGSATAAAIDTTDSGAWGLLVDQVTRDHGGLDLLVNNAGIVQPIDDVTVTSNEDWARIVGVNQTGYFYGMRAAVPALEARGGGEIVNVSSVAGLVCMQNVFTYSATKGAVIAMSRQAAITLAPKKIRVNVICPGIIETPILGDITPELKGYCESMTPLARLGQPLDIGAMAVHLARPESSFITGQVIAIDGGWTAQ